MKLRVSSAKKTILLWKAKSMIIFAMSDAC